MFLSLTQAILCQMPHTSHSSHISPRSLFRLFFCFFSAAASTVSGWRAQSRGGFHFDSPTHPLFPICRTPFPPHVRNEFSFYVFHLEVAFFNESIDAKLNRHAKSRLWARTPTPLLTSGVLPKEGYSGVVVPEKVRTVYNASMIAARPLKSQQQE